MKRLTDKIPLDTPLGRVSYSVLSGTCVALENVGQLVVNRVAMRYFSMTLRLIDGEWKLRNYQDLNLKKDTYDTKDDASPAARDKVKAVMTDLIINCVTPEQLRIAERDCLTKAIAIADKDIAELEKKLAEKRERVAVLTKERDALR